MTSSKFLTWLTAMTGSFCVTTAGTTGHSRSYEVPFSDSDSLVVSPPDTLRRGIVSFFTPDTSKQMLTPEELALMVEIVPNEPDDVIADRLSCLEADIPLVYNNFVRNFIDYFTIRNRKYTRTMLTRENVYFPLFEKYLQKHNMPDELKYLAIVESGLNPLAKSPVGAAGLWQFMKPTGREYGLKQTQHLDERLDPEKSTEAAMRFLKRLHKYYDGDWELALAAYNCGQGNVNKAIRRAGGKKSFWDIFPYLPRETRGYVPSMTAVRYAMRYAGEHNIFTDSILYQPDVAYLEVTQELELDRLAEELHLPPAELTALNPELTKGIVPGNKYKLRVPASRAALLATAEDKSCILLAAAPAAPQPVEAAQAPVLLASARKEAAAAPAEAEPVNVTYTVQRGDNLSSIARRHSVTVEELKQWNNLSSSDIKVAQQLQIAQPATATMLATSETKSEKKQPAIEKKELIHHVQPGDTLWQISRKYEGISVEQIKKLNKLKSNELKPGQKLILG